MWIRFFDKVEYDEDTGCMNWTGGKNWGGYGQFGVRGKTHKAHRLAHRRFIGRIPDGYQIDHLCRNKSCVNPTHLEAVTQAENMRREHRFRAQQKANATAGSA